MLKFYAGKNNVFYRTSQKKASENPQINELDFRKLAFEIASPKIFLVLDISVVYNQQFLLKSAVYRQQFIKNSGSKSLKKSSIWNMSLRIVSKSLKKSSIWNASLKTFCYFCGQ